MKSWGGVLGEVQSAAKFLVKFSGFARLSQATWMIWVSQAQGFPGDVQGANSLKNYEN